MTTTGDELARDTGDETDPDLEAEHELNEHTYAELKMIEEHCARITGMAWEAARRIDDPQDRFDTFRDMAGALNIIANSMNWVIAAKVQEERVQQASPTAAEDLARWMSRGEHTAAEESGLSRWINTPVT